jgi:predicted transcriptional regulator
MKGNVVTVRLDSELKPLLDRAARRTGKSPSAIVREALRRHLLVLQFQRLRRKVMPLAKAKGYTTDEDIFRDFS